jgi:hypothetical protein
MNQKMNNLLYISRPAYGQDLDRQYGNRFKKRKPNRKQMTQLMYELRSITESRNGEKRFWNLSDHLVQNSARTPVSAVMLSDIDVGTFTVMRIQHKRKFAN